MYIRWSSWWKGDRVDGLIVGVGGVKVWGGVLKVSKDEAVEVVVVGTSSKGRWVFVKKKNLGEYLTFWGLGNLGAFGCD